MIDRESTYAIYEVVYRMKRGKKLHVAYVGDDKDECYEEVKRLRNLVDLRYLSVSVTETTVTLFD